MRATDAEWEQGDALERCHVLPQKPELPVDGLVGICQKYHVRELSLFGSAARDELHGDSDLDFLVEFDPEVRVGFLTLSGLSRELSELLHRPVDIVSKAGLKEAIRRQVLADAEVVFAA